MNKCRKVGIIIAFLAIRNFHKCQGNSAFDHRTPQNQYHRLSGTCELPVCQRTGKYITWYKLCSTENSPSTGNDSNTFPNPTFWNMDSKDLFWHVLGSILEHMNILEHHHPPPPPHPPPTHHHHPTPPPPLPPTSTHVRLKYSNSAWMC